MKSTGVVRRIDELGRIVVPKEMRRILHIREGDSIEITSKDEQIVLKKYSLVESVDDFINQYILAIYQINKKEMIITDCEKIISTTNGFRKNYKDKKISTKLENIIVKGNEQTFVRDENIEICEGLNIKNALIIKPIKVYLDVIGAVIVIGDNTINENEKTLATLTSIFIGKYLET